MAKMTHIRKFNEDMDMESNELGFKLVGANLHLLKAEGVPKGDITIDSDVFIGSIYSPERKLTALPDGSELKFGYDEGDAEFVLIVKDGKIEVAIYEYEISNPFIFSDVIIVPGHDSITCYNFKTGEHTTSYIR